MNKSSVSWFLRKLSFQKFDSGAVKVPRDYLFPRYHSKYFEDARYRYDSFKTETISKCTIHFFKIG